jgi:hypothetical protein
MEGRGGGETKVSLTPQKVSFTLKWFGEFLVRFQLRGVYDL